MHKLTQIEKFNSAANTFFEKYGYLPGDIPVALPALYIVRFDHPELLNPAMNIMGSSQRMLEIVR
jgi:hypothetical protein